MRTREVVELGDLLRSSTDAESVAAKLGTIRGRVGDWLLLVTPREPRYAEVRVEMTAAGGLSGIGLTLANPEAVRWDQLEARFGAPTDVRDATEPQLPACRCYGCGSADGELIVLVHRADETNVRQVLLRKAGARS